MTCVEPSLRVIVPSIVGSMLAPDAAVAAAVAAEVAEDWGVMLPDAPLAIGVPVKGGQVWAQLPVQLLVLFVSFFVT